MVRMQSQQWQLTDNLPDELSALLEPPLTLEQGPTASTHTTTEEEEEENEEEDVEETDQISGLHEDLQRRLQEAERRYCELEKEMERLKGEMQDWRAPKETGKGSTALLPLHTIIFIILCSALFHFILYAVMP
ncbi:hypothetical protein F7725_007341 [Dissostichus mawsoni]|uniref:Uncharacterized protein n=1 Tax=Dissostichus mawsoni TaxID=36200 RepID=A0A7J5XY66_DISMA|nr:hypothetical protein F7725_007341 [Dissostichus mawsoni]